MKIKPLHDRILVRRIEEVTKTSGGIIIPDTAKEKPSEGVVEATFELAAGGPVCALNIPVGQWHTLRALECGTVILEMKDGAYEPIGAGDIL